MSVCSSLSFIWHGVISLIENNIKKTVIFISLYRFVINVSLSKCICKFNTL